MDKYVIAPPEGSTNNSVGAPDRPWKEGHFDAVKIGGGDLDTYLEESTGYGIVSGCTPSISGLTVTVAAGVVHLAGGTRKEISATSVTLDSADASNPRIDLVYIDSTGAVAKITGTAAASPSAPTLPSGSISVCNVTIAAVATTGTITDKRQWISVYQKLKIGNVLDYGAVNKDNVDSADAIQRCVNDNDVVYIPAGWYKVSKEITVPYGKTIYGGGVGATNIIGTMSSGYIFNVTDVRKVKIADLRIWDNEWHGYGGIYTSANGVYHDTFATIENVMCDRVSGVGFYVDSGCFDLSIINCKAYHGGSDGFFIYSSDVSIIGCIAGGNLGRGFTVGTSCYMANCKSYGSGINDILNQNAEASGIEIRGTSTALVNCYSQENAGNGLTIVGDGNTVSNIYLDGNNAKCLYVSSAIVVYGNVNNITGTISNPNARGSVAHFIAIGVGAIFNFVDLKIIKRYEKEILYADDFTFPSFTPINALINGIAFNSIKFNGVEKNTTTPVAINTSPTFFFENGGGGTGTMPTAGNYVISALTPISLTNEGSIIGWQINPGSDTNDESLSIRATARVSDKGIIANAILSVRFIDTNNATRTKLLMGINTNTVGSTIEKYDYDIIDCFNLTTISSLQDFQKFKDYTIYLCLKNRNLTANKTVYAYYSNVKYVIG